MSAKKITASLLKEAILKEAKVIKRKQEIFESLKTIESEIGLLNEMGMAGTFGFKMDGDRSQVTKTGFQNPVIFSNIQNLGAEMEVGGENKEVKEEDMIKENEALKKELAELKEKLNSK
jgi:hypothetical protein